MLDAAENLRRVELQDVEDGGHEIDGVDVLPAEPDLVSDAGGPVDDQRIGDPTLVHLALPAAERRVAGHGPSPWVVVVTVRAADLVDPLQRLVHLTWRDVPEAQVVDRARRTALRAGAVVGENEHDRVLQIADVVEVRQQPTDVVVGVGQEAREGLHVAGVQAAVGR